MDPSPLAGTVNDLHVSTSAEPRDSPPELIGSSPAIVRVRELIRRLDPQIPLSLSLDAEWEDRITPQ